MPRCATLNARLLYAGFPSPLGWIYLAAGEKGLCSVEFRGPHPEVRNGAAEALGNRDEHPRLEADAGAFHLREALEALERYFSDKIPLPAAIPLDLSRGTAFQREVWEALRTIAFGETRTYRDVARMVDHPRAARAIGGACGRNPLPLFVPCHRVIASDGKPGGFSAGAHIKKSLLDLERKEI